MITGIDLVREMIRVAQGQPLRLKQSDIAIRGAAIECRINAEDPDKNFMPSPGRVSEIVLPGGPGVRIDTMLYPGYTVPPYYDSLLGKADRARRGSPGRDRAHAARAERAARGRRQDHALAAPRADGRAALRRSAVRHQFPGRVARRPPILNLNADPEEQAWP